MYPNRLLWCVLLFGLNIGVFIESSNCSEWWPRELWPSNWCEVYRLNGLSFNRLVCKDDFSSLVYNIFSFPYIHFLNFSHFSHLSLILYKQFSSLNFLTLNCMSDECILCRYNLVFSVRLRILILEGPNSLYIFCPQKIVSSFHFRLSTKTTIIPKMENHS